jgi:ribosomal protein L11 methylase PrmA
VAADGFAGPVPRALIASGLLVAEADAIAEAFAAHGLTETGRRAEGEWAALLLVSAG